MSDGRRPGSGPGTWPVVVAAALTVVVTVVADVVAGSHLGHIAALGTVAALLGVARVRNSGRHRARFSTLSALIALQPCAHAVIGNEKLAAGMHIIDVDELFSSVQVVIIALIGVAIASVEAVLDVVDVGVRTGLAVLRALVHALVSGQRTPSVTEDAEVRRATDGAPPPGRRTWRHDAHRRGPPVSRAA